MATAGFSFEADIAPLRGQMFGATSEAGFERQRAAERENELRIAEIREAGRNREIAFQQQQLELTRRAEADRDLREALNLMPEALQTITGILDDPEKSDMDKAADLARYRMQVSKAATVSPAISNLFTTAETTLKSRKEQQDRTNALAYTLTQSGETTAVRRLFEGADNPMAGQYITAADAIAESRALEQRQRGESEALKAQQAQEESRIKSEEQTLIGYIDTLQRMRPPSGAEFEGVSLTKGETRAPTTTTAKKQPLQFADEDRIELEELLRVLNPLYEEEDLSRTAFSDDRLYRMVLRSAHVKLQRIRGGPSRMNFSRNS